MENIQQALELFNKQDYDGALIILDDILRADKKNTEALKYKGLSLLKLKQYENAFKYLTLAFEKDKSPEVEGAYGACCYFLKKYELAQVHLIQSVVEEYNEYYAKTLEKALLSKHNDDAMLGLKLLMHENSPKDIYILRDITNLAQKLKKFDIAIEFFNVLLGLCPNDYVAWNNLGLVYEELNRWDEAYSCYLRALKLKDFFSPNFNLGIMSRKMHRFEDSIKYLKKAVLQNPSSPQPKYSLAMSYLMIKDFKSGYPLYTNHMTKIMPSFYKNEWKGDPHPDKTLCVFATGGLGDMLMFGRYLDYLIGYFKQVYILLPKTLHSLFKRNYPFIEVLDSDYVFENFDYAITPMHILKFFNLDFTQFVPNTKGYFEIDNEKIKYFKEKFFNNNKVKIAINWHGNREGTRTFFNRSMPLNAFEPFFEKYKDKAVFYSIQKDESRIELQNYPFIVDLYDEINNFEDTGAILKNVDFLISIDSSPVHMAGAVGKKCYVMLPYANEWRWFADDKKSIWYDSVLLFRQDKEGDLESVVNKVLAEIKF